MEENKCFSEENFGNKVYLNDRLCFVFKSLWMKILSQMYLQIVQERAFPKWLSSLGENYSAGIGTD